MRIPGSILAAILLGAGIGIFICKFGERADLLAAGKNPPLVVIRVPRGNSARVKSVNIGSEAADDLVKGDKLAELSVPDAILLLKSLRPDGSKTDPLEFARKNYQFQMTIRKLPLQILEQVMDQAGDKEAYAVGSRDIFKEYVIRDAKKAMEWASRQKDADELKIVAINMTAASDPYMAAEMLQQALAHGSSGKTWEASLHLSEIYAKQGAGVFFKFLDTLPSNGLANFVSSAPREIPKEDMPRFLEETAKRIENKQIDSFAMDNILMDLGTSDPDLAWKWIEKTESTWERAQREAIFARTLSEQGKMGEALDIVKGAMSLEPGKEKDFFGRQVVKLFPDHLDFALQIQTLLPAGVEITKGDLEKISGGMGNKDCVALTQFLSSSEQKANYLVSEINNLGKYSKPSAADLEILSNRIQSITLTEDDAADVRRALDAYREK